MHFSQSGILAGKKGSYQNNSNAVLVVCSTTTYIKVLNAASTCQLKARVHKSCKLAASHSSRNSISFPATFLVPSKVPSCAFLSLSSPSSLTAETITNFQQNFSSSKEAISWITQKTWFDSRQVQESFLCLLRKRALRSKQSNINPLKPELNPICYLLALLGAHHFLHVSRIRVKLLTLR